MSEVSGNLFFTTKNGYKAHLQIKMDGEGDSGQAVLNALGELETAIGLAGGKPENASGGATKPRGGSEPRFESKQDTGNGECVNGCGIRPWIEGGVSKKTGKPYNAFWGECRTCGYKGR